jgi:hypothetical protein
MRVVKPCGSELLLALIKTTLRQPRKVQKSRPSLFPDKSKTPSASSTRGVSPSSFKNIIGLEKPEVKVT